MRVYICVSMSCLCVFYPFTFNDIGTGIFVHLFFYIIFNVEELLKSTKKKKKFFYQKMT